MWSRSMLWPTKPSRAGRRVSAPAMTSRTARIDPTAKPSMDGCCTTNSPSREITTVLPAKSTARPAVAIATTAASRGSRPSVRNWR